jgi:hypothetical protein
MKRNTEICKDSRLPGNELGFYRHAFLNLRPESSAYKRAVWDHQQAPTILTCDARIPFLMLKYVAREVGLVISLLPRSRRRAD